MTPASYEAVVLKSVDSDIRLFYLSEVDMKHDRDLVRPHRNSTWPYLTI